MNESICSSAYAEKKFREERINARKEIGHVSAKKITKLAFLNSNTVLIVWYRKETFKWK